MIKPALSISSTGAGLSYRDGSFHVTNSPGAHSITFHILAK